MSHERRKTISSHYVDFADMARRDLKYHVDRDFSAAKPRTETGKALWSWYCALGALAYDISGACLALLKTSQLRAAMILNRCLFEYWLRLAFYRKEPVTAENDIAQMKARLGHILAHSPVPPTEEESQEMSAYVKDADRVGNRKIYQMLEKVLNNPIDVEQHYRHMYALHSMFVHGNELIFFDLYRSFFASEEDEMRTLDYETERLDADDLAISMIHLVLWTTGAIELISDWGRSFIVNTKSFEILQRSKGDWRIPDLPESHGNARRSQ